MNKREHRSEREQALYEKVLAEIKEEGALPESHWHVAAEKRFKKALIAQQRFEQELPLREGLREHGVLVRSVWDLSNDDLESPAVVMLLLDHLNGPYDDPILDGIVRALGRTKGHEALVTQTLLATFESTENATFSKESMGYVLARFASPSDSEKLLALLQDRSHGQARSGLVDGIVRLMKDESVQLLIKLLEDADVRNNVIENLGALKAREATPYLEPFLNHRDSYVRQIAKKAIRQCEDKRGKSRLLPAPSEIEDLSVPLYEASINLDIDDLNRRLQSVNRKLKLKLPVKSLVEVSEDLVADDEKGFTFRVSYNGADVDLHVRTYKDDVDTCSLYLFTPSKSLRDAIDEVL